MSSSMLMGSEQNSSCLNLGEDPQATRNDHQQTAERKNSSSSGSGSTRRKPSRASEGVKKKQPQRGMGVAQLERLRLQERWKKITQINSVSSSPSLLPSSLNGSCSLFSEPKGANICPVQYPKFCGLGTGVNGVGPNLMQQGFMGQKEGNGGGGQLFRGQGLSSDDVLQTYLFGNGNSKELSSMPKVSQCFTDHCSDCLKKKRTFTGENLMFNEVNKYANLPSVAGCGFPGLDIGRRGQNDKGGNGDLEKKATFLHSGTSALGFCNKDQGVEVIAVEKQGSSRSSGSGVPNGLMEYEFFPGKGGYRSYGSSQNELLMMKKLRENSESSAVMDGEGSRFATTTTSSTTTTGGASVGASTSIDLSLRLSY